MYDTHPPTEERIAALARVPASASRQPDGRVRGEESVDPMQQVFQIGNAQMPVDDWAAFCAREGLSGPIGPLD